MQGNSSTVPSKLSMKAQTVLGPLREGGGGGGGRGEVETKRVMGVSQHWYDGFIWEVTTRL